MRGQRWAVVLAGLVAAGSIATGQSVDLAGPTAMGRCEVEPFTVAFTAGAVQTASAIVFRVTLPNATFTYVTGSGLITLDDGTPVPAEPSPSGLDLVWNLDPLLGYPYELPPGETVTLRFELRTGCGTISGTLAARVDYASGGLPNYATDSQPVQILPGAILIYKEPSVIPAAVGDEVVWTLIVENTGFGPVYNVVVTDVLGSGLVYVSSSPSGVNVGPTTTWEFPTIPAGNRVEIEFRARVIACVGLSNRLDARFGCDGGPVCFDTAVHGGTATASIRLLLGQPLLTYTPPEIRIPYCSPLGATVTMPIRNIGDGNARQIRFCANFSPYTVTNVVPPASYSNGCFQIPDLAPGESFDLTFDVVYLGNWCAAPGNRDVFYQPIYRNDCGEEFRPPVGFFSPCYVSYLPDGPPSLSLSLTGLGEIHICQNVAYQVTSSFSGLASCGGGTQGDVTVVVNVPVGFTVEDTGGGGWVPGPGGTGGTITWTYAPPSSLDTSIVLRPPGAPRCGTLATLTATASAVDCCGCTLSAARSLPVAIECRTLVGSTKTDTSPQEKCGPITYTNTYTFADNAALDGITFDELTFVETAANSQAYVPGSLVITVDGNPASPITVIDTTPGGTLRIEGINYPGSVRGTVLVISYDLVSTPASAPQACPGSSGFYTWSTLDLGPDCEGGDECTQYCTKSEAEWVEVETPRMSVALSGLPNLVDPCGTYNVTLTLTKTSTYDPHNVVLRLGNLNYYIVDLASIECTGTVSPTNCTTPTDSGTYYEWTYGEAFVGQPAGAQSVLRFQVRKRCGPGLELRATALYTDACGGSCSVAATNTPLLLRTPNLFVYKTPEVYYATVNTQVWTIYVVNSGSGPAYGVWVDDLLGDGLEYVSSSVSPGTGVTTYPNQDHLGNPINGVSWRIAEIPAGQQRVITLETRLVVCRDLWNEVTTSYGCGGEDCAPAASDRSTVVIPTTQLTATSSTGSPINTCATQTALIRIRNTGDPAAYELVARETLPVGISYVPGTTRWRKGTAPWQAGGDPTIVGQTLEWTELEVPGLSELRSRQTLEIEFGIQALCDFTGGDLLVSVDYLNVCRSPGSVPVGTFRLQARRPSLSVNKVQVTPAGNGPVDCGALVTWRIDVTNTGQIAIPYVWVEDELGSAFTYVSSTGGGYGVDNGCAVGSTVTWALQNLPAGATAQLTLTARHTSCDDLTNTVRAWWGCGVDTDGSSCTSDDICLTNVPATRTITASRDPNVTLSASLDPGQVPSCGTTTFTLTVTNPSTASAAAVDVRIGLPTGLTYVLGSTSIDCGSGFTPAPDPVEAGGFLYWYDPNGPTNLCAGIPAGGTVRLRFNVQASCYRTTGNAGIVVYYYDCCELAQRQATGSRSLAPSVPTLTITKLPATVPLDCFDVGSTVTWTITVQNTGAAPADWVRVEDTLGANLVYVSSNPTATPMGGQRWGWEFGPLGQGGSRTFEITVRMSQPPNDCANARRTNTAQAFWGCGTPDGDPNTLEGCQGGSSAQATARATIPDLTLNSTDIVPVLTCAGDGNYSGQVQVTIRNAGDAAVSRDFRLTLTEATSGWSVSGLFNANFGGTLPIAAGGSRTITIPNWPVTCGQCTYSFTVSLDTEDVLCECRENNNGATRAWTITLPDLTVRADTLALTCAGDGQVRIAGTVTLGNEGCGNNLTANVPVRFTLRDRSGCTGTDLYTWTETFTGVNLPAKGEQTFSVSRTFALDLCGIPGCAVSLLIEADHTNSICECDGTNNTRCVELPVNIPDLAVRRDTLVLTCAGDGQVRIAGTVTLGNEGCGNNLTASVPVRFTLRNGSGCSGAVLYTWTETFTGVNLPAKGEQTFSVSRTFALDLCTEATSCAVSLLIEADYTGSICECNGGNNTRCVEFPFSVPDLRVTSVVPVVGNACQPGTVRVTVENVGCGMSPAGVIVRITGSATGETVLPSLAPGISEVVTVTLNEVLPCGSHAITATVDPGNEVCECSSANNALGAGFTVVDPDLRITDLLVQCRGDGSFTVTATARNGGTEASPATRVRVYVNGALFQELAVPPLAVGGAHPLTYVTHPIKCGLEHLFRLIVDEDNEICECNEGNNWAEAGAVCPCPGLVTGKATTQILRAGLPVPTNSPVQAGDLITYTLTVRNVGGGLAFNVDLWDELPAEFLYVAGTTNASWPGGSSTADPSGAPGPYLSWDLSATLLPGETLTLSFQAFVTSGVLHGASYTNTMGATGNEGDGTPIPPESGLPGDDDPDDESSVTHPAAVPALALDKAITDVLRGGASRGPAGPVEPGDVIVYTVTIRNVGFGVAYNVDFTDVLPHHTEYDTTYGDGTYTVDNPPAGPLSLGIPDGATGTITANVSATLAVGGTLTAVYRVRVLSTVSQGVDLVNNAVTTGEDGAGTPIPEFNPHVSDSYPDRDSTRIPVVEPGLSLEKEIVNVLRGGVSIWPTPIVLWGDVIQYQVTVRNVGLGTAYGVDLTDELPLGVAYDTTYGDGTYTVDSPASSGFLGVPDGATGLISAPIGVQINSGGTLIAVYRVRVTPQAVPGSWLTNLAVVTGEDGADTPIPEFNPDVGDNYPDRDTTRIRLGAPALVTRKEFYCERCDPCAPDPVECAACPGEPIVATVGSTIPFRLIVTNVGYSNAYDLVVEDRLPAGLTYVEKTGVITWPGGRVEVDPWVSPGPVLTWVTGIALGPGETLIITFTARVNADAPVGEEVRNVLWAGGVDDFNTPIPADSSTLVPADDDPDDMSVLRLIIRPGSTGSPGLDPGPLARAAGWGAAVGLVLLTGAAGATLRRTRSPEGR